MNMPLEPVALFPREPEQLELRAMRREPSLRGCDRGSARGVRVSELGVVGAKVGQRGDREVQSVVRLRRDERAAAAAGGGAARARA